MKNITLLSFILLFLISCGKEEEKTQNSGIQLNHSNAVKKKDIYSLKPCSGNEFINSASSEESLIELFGKKNVRNEKILYDEGTKEYNCAIIFPETEDQLIIKWKDEKNRKDPESVEIYQKDSRWNIDGKIFIGLELEKLVELNGGNFMFWGFGWDNGGSVLSWENGALSEIKGFSECVKIRLDYDYSQTMTSGESRIMIGDKEVSSGEPALKKFDCKIANITLFFK